MNLMSQHDGSDVVTTLQAIKLSGKKFKPNVATWCY